MALVYDDKSVRGGSMGTFDPLRCDAVKKYMGHYSNKLFLRFMLENGDVAEKHAASNELTICDRKMAYWERQPHFEHARAIQEIAKAKREWKR